MSKHTPGPWEAAERGEYLDYGGRSRVIFGDGIRLAVVHHNDVPEDEANARLIAAAPDLLAAIRSAPHPLGHSDSRSFIDAYLAWVHSALDIAYKAEGRTDA